MAFANSFYNPIVYSAMNRNFRQGFKEIFCSKRKANWTNDNATQSSGETDNSVTSKVTSHLEIALQDAQVNPMKPCQSNSKVC